MIIDTHCHFDMMSNPESFIQQREQAGDIVIGMTNLPSHFRMGIPYIRTYKHIRLALGLHPLLAAENKNEIALFKKYIDQTSYIGEIGLDFSKKGIANKAHQIKTLIDLLKSLKGKKKIISVHSRKAENVLLNLFCEYKIENVIFHWYSGSVNLIPSIISEGYYFSINEAMTISNNGRAIIERIPRNRILTETDAPYNKKANINKVLTYTQMTEQDVKNNFMELIAKIQ